MAEPTGTLPWRLERYRDGDEHDILELFRTVFGKSRSVEHWIWQFKSNPYGGPFISMARRESDGAVVGSYSVMPIMLNVMGKAVRACQSVDTAVHPDHRGQRIFEVTASDCYAWCQSEGLRAVIGFPNSNSYPGFVRTLGWRRILFPTKHMLRLGVRSGLERTLRVPVLPWLADAAYGLARRGQVGLRRAALRRLTRQVAFRTSSQVPEGYESLWNACRSYEVLSVWKDAAYMAWRYDRNPDHRFIYLFLAHGGDIPALAVGVEIDGALALCELMVAGRDLVTGRRLVTEVCNYALDRGHRGVTFLGYDAGVATDILQGFSRQTAYGDVFGGKTLGDDETLAERLPLAANWTVTFGDGDFV